MQKCWKSSVKLIRPKITKFAKEVLGNFIKPNPNKEAQVRMKDVKPAAAIWIDFQSKIYGSFNLFIFNI